MCGRYALTVQQEALSTAYGVERIFLDHEPRYNIAPTQIAPVLVRDEVGDKIGPLRWGLIPFWAKDPSIGNRLINARSETVGSKPAFKEAFFRRRCLVLADGFFEWMRTSEAKVPWFLHRPDREPFTMAGLWERWRPEGGEPVHSFTILTRPATEDIRRIHNRMPVILDRAAGDAWLIKGQTEETLREVLAVGGQAELLAYAVSTEVNSPKNDSPGCVLPVQKHPERADPF